MVTQQLQDRQKHPDYHTPMRYLFEQTMKRDFLLLLDPIRHHLDVDVQRRLIELDPLMLLDVLDLNHA
jgi:hypothetical protein